MWILLTLNFFLLRKLVFIDIKKDLILLNFLEGHLVFNQGKFEAITGL